MASCDRQMHLLELPTDTLVDILLRLPAKSVHRIKSVSKTLLNLVDNLSFSILHTRSLLNSPADEVTPQLMCCSFDVDMLTLQSLEYEYEHNSLRKGKHAIIVSFIYCGLSCAFGNVFCFENRKGSCMLVNGIGERGVLWLPERERYLRPNIRREFEYGMGIDDKTNTYKVVCVTTEVDDARTPRKKLMSAHVLVLGSKSWRKIPSLPPIQLSLTYEKKPVCANGGVHWWTRSARCSDRLLVTFDLRSEEFYLTPTPHKYSDSVINIFSLRGCLAFVEATQGQMEIWVMKSLDEKKWVKCYYFDNLPRKFPAGGFSGEWKHGIFFMDKHWYLSRCEFYFIDVRSGNISNRVDYSSYTVPNYEHYTRGERIYFYPSQTVLQGMCNYSETLISLKHYGNLDKSHYKWIESDSRLSDDDE